ncbi:MAG: T9SS type A sorting domain-containing protein [Saprospirales bacterium]|jgi:hypothetical protein|nr:T9SS type A sorting domain-containing protein [Saprospirales bacterium]MBK8921787.1 T9SS type A sorting domain-containing protein [Saprospirales bacterium]
MKQIILAILLLPTGYALAGQNRTHQFVVGAQGGADGTETLRLNWTLGEPAVLTLQTPSGGQLTEGFHQPALQVTEIVLSDGSPAAEQAAFRVTAFPNPTTGLLYLQFGQAAGRQWLVELFDPAGQRIRQDKLDQPVVHEIDLQQLPAGHYYLYVRTTDGALRQYFQVVKQH